VKIGVQAPKNVFVHREINERVVAEGKTRRSVLSIRKVIPKRSPSLGPPSGLY
jgi:sRNA-binding carbon storage regulator CsrA